MGLEIGTKLGSFEISDLLGKGGMGEVYRATDSKLGRDVAIKGVAGWVCCSCRAVGTVWARGAGVGFVESCECGYGIWV